MITTTIVDFIPNNSRYHQWKSFKQYTADNGNSIYTIDGKIVSKNEGNNIFVNLIRSSKEYTVEKSTLDLSTAEIIKNLQLSIDEYPEMIDNYQQYKSALAHNDKIYHLISEFEKIADIQEDKRCLRRDQAKQ